MAAGDYSQDAQNPAPKVRQPKPVEKPIDKLRPESDQHKKVLEYCLERIRHSEMQMSRFYSRWNSSEKKIQAYISLPDYENQLKEMNKSGSPPSPISIVVPYSYATIWTIVTYMIHTFCGQKPIFPVSSYKAENVQSAEYMQTVLQFNADHTRMILRLIQWFLDAEIYGLGAVSTLWSEEFRKKTVWNSQSAAGMVNPIMTPKPMRMFQSVKVFEGNEVCNIDPYLFFPDPRVPMADVARKGEYVFWRSYESQVSLLRAQADGQLKWVKEAGDLPATRNTSTSAGQSQRSLIAGGDATPGQFTLKDARAKAFIQVDQGTVEIIPNELGLGDSNVPCKWLFSIANEKQIIQAEEFDYNHGRHPVAVIEPSSFGYAFGQPGTMDFLGPIQDTLSWFINSHIHNVRTALNNMFVVDPSMVEMQDLKNPGPGKLIRLKRSAYGQDVKTVLQQLQVQDVTSNHIESMQVFLRMGDVLSAVNDNLRGIQESGGRKTATEVRTAGEAGASRLAARARYISAQGMTDLSDQMAQNLQQKLSMEYYLQVVGEKGQINPIAESISPQMLAGDFQYPVSDGTLPLDKAGLLQVWKEIWMAIMQAPVLSQQYDAGKIFEYIAELGGAKNIASFKITAAPTDQLAAAASAGNAVPLPGAVPGGTGAAARQGAGNGAQPGGANGYAPPIIPRGSGAGVARPIA